MPFVSKKPKLKLSEEDLEILRSTSRSRTMPLRAIERAKMILGYYNGDTISAIARSIGTNRQKVERTIDKALALGIKVALEDLHRKGRPRSISSEARAWIISLACSKPKDYGYASELWTNRALTGHIRDKCNEFTALSELGNRMELVTGKLKKEQARKEKIMKVLENLALKAKFFQLNAASTTFSIAVKEAVTNANSELTRQISHDRQPMKVNRAKKVLYKLPGKITGGHSTKIVELAPIRNETLQKKIERLCNWLTEKQVDNSDGKS